MPLDAMKLLMDKGAKYDLVDSDGVTPLMAVASQGNLEGQTMTLGGSQEQTRVPKK